MSTVSSMIHYIDSVSTSADAYLCGVMPTPGGEFTNGTITKAEVTCLDCTRLLTTRDRRNDREHPVNDPHKVAEAIVVAKDIADERTADLEAKVDELTKTVQDLVDGNNQ